MDKFSYGSKIIKLPCPYRHDVRHNQGTAKFVNKRLFSSQAADIGVRHAISDVKTKKLSCRWQTARRICANAMAWLTS